MGDRANICIYDTEPDAKGQRPCICFYTHWSGRHLPEILARALKRAEARWDDPQYLSRAIFCEMVAFPQQSISVAKWHDEPIEEVRAYARDLSDSMFDLVGYGISTFLGDGGNRVIYVDATKQTVTIGLTTWTFAEYVAQADHGWEG